MVCFHRLSTQTTTTGYIWHWPQFEMQVLFGVVCPQFVGRGVRMIGDARYLYVFVSPHWQASLCFHDQSGGGILDRL